MNPRLDSREAWTVTTASVLIIAVSFAAPYVSTVALKTIAAEFGGQRAIPSAATSLAFLGTGLGGLGMGWLADRIGVRQTVMLGAVMIAIGLALASTGGAWLLLIGHGLFIGLIGNGAINAPLYVYVTRWFEKRRGTALALIASGQYIAGAVWPPIFEPIIRHYGWRTTMLAYAGMVLVLILPLAFVFLKPPPPAPEPVAVAKGTAETNKLFGLPPNLVFVMLAIASFLCCVPMSMPSTQLIAFCGDLGMAPASGAFALSLLLGTAFLSRQFWGWVSDRIGGLSTLVICSAAQAAAITGFMFTQTEAGLFAVAGAFGLGFSGLIPAYILTARQFFPASEASWRLPLLLLTAMTGMATGGWVAGLLYDHFGSYAPAFATGLTLNLVNFSILAVLFLSRWRASAKPVMA